MHPILAQLRQLGLYLLAWVPLGGILAHQLVSSAGLDWSQAVALMAPLCLVYAFICLSAWYPCRVTPLEQSGFTRLGVTHLASAAIVSSLWVGLAKGLAALLARWAHLEGLDSRIAPHYAFLWFAGVLLYLLSVTFHYVLLAEQASREAQARALEAQVLAREAELKALRAQVNPHFLFNCLHSISALTSADAAKARQMSILLADFLRTTLRLGSKESITLEQELSLVRSYLAIEKVRFGARLRMEESLQPEVMSSLIPPLLLQPLVENAVRHGIANLLDGGVIRLQAYRKAGGLTIAVENSFDPDSPASLKTGLGLANIRERLATRYGDSASISVRSDGDCFFVGLQLPGQNEGTRR